MAEEACQNVQFSVRDSRVHGYLRTPKSSSGPGVIDIQEWWGLTTHMADIVDRLADEGFVALAPDLYGGRATHDAAEAMTMMTAVPAEQAVCELAGAVDYLLAQDSVTSATAAAIGFCMGGGFVFGLAAAVGNRLSAIAPFYGLPSDLSAVAGITAAVQGHFGLQDTSVPPARVAEVFAALEAGPARSAEYFEYPAGHAFVNDENLIAPTTSAVPAPREGVRSTFFAAPSADLVHSGRVPTFWSKS